MFVYFYSLCNSFFLLPVGISLHLIGKMASNMFRNVLLYKNDVEKLLMSLFFKKIPAFIRSEEETE